MSNTASITAIETQILKIHKTINALLGEVISLTETVTAMRNDSESSPRRPRTSAPAHAPEVAPEVPAAVEIVPAAPVAPAEVAAETAPAEAAPASAPEVPVEVAPEVPAAAPVAVEAAPASRQRRTRDQIINDVVAGTGTFPTSWKGDVLAQAQAEVAALRAALPAPTGTFPPVSGLFQQVTPASVEPDIQPVAETAVP